MYCIVQVIYGVPIRKAALEEVEMLGKELSDFGGETMYSGSGDEEPAYIGVQLSAFDEATDMALSVSGIRHVATPAEVIKAKALIAALPSVVSSKITDKEGVYFIFSTS